MGSSESRSGESDSSLSEMLVDSKDNIHTLLQDYQEASVMLRLRVKSLNQTSTFLMILMPRLWPNTHPPRSNVPGDESGTNVLGGVVARPGDVNAAVKPEGCDAENGSGAHSYSPTNVSSGTTETYPCKNTQGEASPILRSPGKCP